MTIQVSSGPDISIEKLRFADEKLRFAEDSADSGWGGGLSVTGAGGGGL